VRFQHFPSWAEPKRFLRFGLVGTSGVIVNGLVVWASTELLLGRFGAFGLRIAFALGVVISVFSNFLLNEAWTFRDRPRRRGQRWIARLGRYCLAAFGGAMLQLIVSVLCTEKLGVPYLWATLVGVAAGTICNYLSMRTWVFTIPATDSSDTAG